MADILQFRRKPRPLRKEYDPSAPYEVERVDYDDGTISYLITDVRPDSYRIICVTDDEGNPYAKHDAEQIARGLNMLVEYKMEQLPNIRELPDDFYDCEGDDD